MEDNLVKLRALALLRDEWRNSNNPELWNALAEAYEAIGALSNAADCRRRAEHYSAVLLELSPVWINA
jgi:predicted Zn-dependent protease